MTIDPSHSPLFSSDLQKQFPDWSSSSFCTFPESYYCYYDAIQKCSLWTKSTFSFIRIGGGEKWRRFFFSATQFSATSFSLFKCSSLNGKKRQKKKKRRQQMTLSLHCVCVRPRLGNKHTHTNIYTHKSSSQEKERVFQCLLKWHPFGATAAIAAAKNKVSSNGEPFIVCSALLGLVFI